MLSAQRVTASASRSSRRPYLRRPVRDWRSYATAAEVSKFGGHLHGFTHLKSKDVPELELSAHHFRHDRSGADYLHLARDDKNNAFAIAFKTNPPDATGVPHILEHTTLCGSERYPVRDPFFKMLPRSLQNFMNAMTSLDYTYYPFATTNAQDFRNLMSVYLDATLHPLLKQSDFVQEGWRIGPANPKAEGGQGDADLTFKGVVYNEMKGQMSDATYLFYIRFYEQIIPALNNSGGDPQKMTELTYEQLKRFHHEHYHPSNSKILTYGDRPIEEHLSMLGERLGAFNMVAVDQDHKLPISLAAPKEINVRGPLDPLTPPNAQFKTSMSWILGDRSDIHEDFAMSVALGLLLDGYGSPMYRALIESGLGTDFTPNTGYDTSSKRGMFSVGLNGVSEENLPLVRAAIHSTLVETAERGFSQEKIDGLLHQLELGLKHKTAKLGMGMINRILPNWMQGNDPFDGMDYDLVVNTFKQRYAQGNYLEGILKKYLLTENVLTFTMEPDPNFGLELAAEEQARLKTKITETVKQYSSEEEAHQALRDRELQLIAEQDSGRDANVECLPTLRVSDIPRQTPPTEVRDGVVDNGVSVQWRETPTNGLTYFKALSVFEGLPDELRMLIPLFCDSLMRIGTRKKSMEELEDLIKLKTGGIGFSYTARSSPHDIGSAEEAFLISGYAFDRNVAAMYELIQALLLETDFDSPKAHQMIKQLLQAGASGAVDDVAASGHAYAMRAAAAGLTPHGRMAEQTGGLTQVKLITGLAAAEENAEAMAALIVKLKAIQGTAVRNMLSGQMRVAITCGKDNSAAGEKALDKFLRDVKSWPLDTPPSITSSSSAVPQYPSSGRTFFDLPYQVYYSSLSLPTSPYTSQSSAPFAVLAKLLTHKHLHHEIREKGGAYGGGAFSSGLGGLFGMYSYRDPNPVNTIQTYLDAGRWAAERSWNERELEEAKLSLFQAVDAPESVNQEGMTRFLQGVDSDMEQKRREWLLDVNPEDVRQAAQKLNDHLPAANLVVLGKKAGFVDEAEGWKVEDLGIAGPAVEATEEALEASTANAA